MRIASMGREKKSAPGAGVGAQAKERHKRDRRYNYDWSAPLPDGLVAKPTQPKSKHHSYFEFVENKDKKKKLEYQITTNRDPPPGFEFVPIGNPELTTACKELSRERDAMIFIVSAAKGQNDKELSLHLNRVGHHIRQTIVEEARASLGELDDLYIEVGPGKPEPIPQTQEEINAQADAALRDLFPRIPNTDRQMIIEHAFKKGATMNGYPLVGLAPDITLSRRVQLAVLAHIRHRHTRYDSLLRETTYVNARKAVEALCLDIIVKWRGDEETGRDQLDEILREVIVISDSEDDSDDDSDDDDSVREVSPGTVLPAPNLRARPNSGPAIGPPKASASVGVHSRTKSTTQAEEASLASHSSRRDRKTAKRAQRGFKRYQAVYDRVWHDAVERQRHGDSNAAPQALPMDRSASHGSNLWQTGDPERQRPDYYVEDGLSPDMFYAGSRHLLGGKSEYRPEIRYADDGGMQPRGGKPPVLVTSRPPRAATEASADSRFIVPGGLTPKVGLNPGAKERLSNVAPVVRSRGDLKDWLVLSTEPRSPELLQYPPRSIPVGGIPLDRGQPELAPLRSGPQHPEPGRSSGPFTIDETPYKRRRVLDDEPEVIRIASRHGLGRAVVAPSTSHDANNFPPPQSRETGRIVTRESPGSFHRLLAPSARTPPLYGDYANPLPYRPRADVIEDRGMPPKRIVVPARPAERLQHPPLSPGFIEIRRPAHGIPLEHEHRRIASSDSSAHRPSNSCEVPIEAIPVSNMFPRPHAAAPAPGSGERFRVRPVSPQYSIRRIERVEEPVYREVSGPFPREERVVRIEYVEPGYRPDLLPPHTESALPHTYISPRPYSATVHSAPPRDGVIYIE